MVITSPFISLSFTCKTRQGGAFVRTKLKSYLSGMFWIAPSDPVNGSRSRSRRTAMQFSTQTDDAYTFMYRRPLSTDV